MNNVDNDRPLSDMFSGQVLDVKWHLMPNGKLSLSQRCTNYDDLYDSVNKVQMPLLLDELNKKFNYMVNYFWAKNYEGRVLGVCPVRSNLCTALVWYNSKETRYEIYSPRIFRERKLNCANPLNFSMDQTLKCVVGVKDPKRAASVIASIVPFRDAEVTEHLFKVMADDIGKIVTNTSHKFYEMFNEFRSGLDKTAHEEIVRMLDAISSGELVDLATDGSLITKYTNFANKRKALREKHEFVGEVAPMMLYQSYTSEKLLLSTRKFSIGPSALWTDRDEVKYEGEVLAKSYESFDDLPSEVQNAVRTLEVSEKGSKGDVAEVGYYWENIGAVFSPNVCSFVVPKHVHDNFVEELMPAEDNAT